MDRVLDDKEGSRRGAGEQENEIVGVLGGGEERRLGLDGVLDDKGK